MSSLPMCTRRRGSGARAGGAAAGPGRAPQPHPLEPRAQRGERQHGGHEVRGTRAGVCHGVCAHCAREGGWAGPWLAGMWLPLCAGRAARAGGLCCVVPVAALGITMLWDGRCWIVFTSSNVLALQGPSVAVLSWQFLKCPLLPLTLAVWHPSDCAPGEGAGCVGSLRAAGHPDAAGGSGGSRKLWGVWVSSPCLGSSSRQAGRQGGEGH